LWWGRIRISKRSVSDGFAKSGAFYEAVFPLLDDQRLFRAGQDGIVFALDEFCRQEGVGQNTVDVVTGAGNLPPFLLYIQYLAALF